MIDSQSCHVCGGMMYAEIFDDFVCEKCGRTEEFSCCQCDSTNLIDYWDSDVGIHFGKCEDCGDEWILEVADE